MKNILGMIMAFAVIGATAFGFASNEVQAAPQCNVTSVGPRGEAFSIKGNTATVKFKATGQTNCKVELSTFSFYAQQMNGRPYDKQILFAKNTKTFGPGVHKMSVKIPLKSNQKKGCFYQVDLDYGRKIETPVLAYGHGKVNCGSKPTKIKVCDVRTNEIVVINKKDMNNKRYTKDLSMCRQVTAEKIWVCELETKEIVRISEKDFDETMHSMDLNDCAVVPAEPKEPKTEKGVVPEALPETGPVEILAQLVGAVSLAGSSAYYLASRRQ